MRADWFVGGLTAAMLALSGCAHARAQTVNGEPALRVETEPRDHMLAVGDPVPRFHAIAQNGRVLDVAPAPRNDILIVYFYPRDETSG